MRSSVVGLGTPSIADEPRDFGPQLFQAAAISFAFFEEDFGHFRVGLELGFSKMLNLQIHHFFNQSY